MQVPLYCLGGTEAKKERIKTLFLWIFPLKVEKVFCFSGQFVVNGIFGKKVTGMYPFHEAVSVRPSCFFNKTVERQGCRVYIEN